MLPADFIAKERNSHLEICKSQESRPHAGLNNCVRHSTNSLKTRQAF